jgi:hypothetical protein
MSLSALSAFRRGSQRDDRRRRLLMEDVSGYGARNISAPLDNDPSLPPKSSHYGNGEFLLEQPRLIDLLPRSLLGLFLVELLGFASLAGLAGLHFWSLKHPDLFGQSGWNAFNLSQHGALGTWISALCLLAATLAALAIYSVRRHRVDDYQGRYRIWLWAALGLFLFATDLSAGLHSLFQQRMIHWTGTPLWRGGELWWMIPAALLFGALGSRVLVDMWPCRLAIASMLLGGACYAISLLADLQILRGGDPVQFLLLHHGTALGGHFLLLMALLYQARFVLLDAEGLIPHLPKDASCPTEIPDTEFQEVADSSPGQADSFRRVDSPQGVPQPILRRAAPLGVRDAQARFSASPPAPIHNVQRKLTRQEKKALRERLIRERLKREGKL